jgi:hypothetical protein
MPSVAGAFVRSAYAAETEEVLPSFIADISGNQTLGKIDRSIVEAALGSRRGFGVAPDQGFDHRADVFGRGRVDASDFDAVKRAHRHLAANAADERTRPITVNWHYGWFNFPTRQPREHHVWYKGGAYSSRDPDAEQTFNELKNEFGITVDALSWADPERDGNLNNNLYQGYMQAPNLETRHVALLYESLISLQPRKEARADFTKRLIRERLAANFASMGECFAHLRDNTPARLLLIDGRPVIFVYASHTWGLNVDGTGEQYDLIDESMERAIAGFEWAYGRPPFIIGEEMTLGLSDRFDAGRQRRSANFDGVFVYHHASSDAFVEKGEDQLGEVYRENVKEVAAHTYDGALEHTSRFTGKPMLVVPSLAAGFSRAGARTLFANRSQYADFLKDFLRFHHDQYMVRAYGEPLARKTPPIVTIGSWNEEWEGHAVLPAEFNVTVSPRTQEGFDYLMAIKQVFGWNHYLQRSARLAHR